MTPKQRSGGSTGGFGGGRKGTRKTESWSRSRGGSPGAGGGGRGKKPGGGICLIWAFCWTATAATIYHYL